MDKVGGLPWCSKLHSLSSEEEKAKFTEMAMDKSTEKLNEGGGRKERKMGDGEFKTYQIATSD